MSGNLPTRLAPALGSKGSNVLTIQRAPVLDAIVRGIILAMSSLLLAEPSLAADDECDSDSGIPSGVIAPIDVGHLRKSLANAGFAVGGFYLGETFANTGGNQQSATYDGVIWTYLSGDLHKTGLWKGLCFYTDAYQIHGRSITADVGSLVTVSNYEALPSTRLSELWLEQHMFDDRLTIRVGQLTADTEFLLSSGGSNFLDSTWGWATLPSTNLPGGGPSYPLATPGVRVALKPNDKWSLMLGVYNGDPAGAHCTGNPQACDDNGLDFRFDSPPLLIAEGRYKYNQDGHLPGTLKIGGWNQFGTLHDQPFGSGIPTVAMTFNSVPIESDWAIYGIIDQLVWRVPDSKDANGIGLFGRVIGAPTEQNLIDFYADGGVTFGGMIPHRAEDTLGVGLAYTHISNDVHGFDGNRGPPGARTHETLLEICYTAQLKSGWTLQPDFQYIWQSSGSEPSDKGTIPNAAVWGVRTTINF
jgi:porin